MYNHASMNKVYRIVWNATLGVWQAVSEIGKGAGKGTSDSRKKRHASALAGAVFLISTQVYANSLPQNGTVTLGSGSLSQPNASTLNITQNTQKMAIDWQSFNVGQGNTVNFIQPSASAIALNRVVGSDVSSIQGAINANGQVFLINPNGVLFSTTAQVNVGGLVASTRNITNEHFAAGKFNFEGTNSNAIINQGNIKTADGGYVVMIAAKIDNQGSITAKQGLVGMASGDSVTLDMGGPVKLKVNVGTLNSLISNGGAINADAGHILLSAKAAGDLAASVINNTGIIEAKTLTTTATGKIELQGDLISHTGTLDASAVQGTGGNISVNAGLLIDAGKTTVSGSQGGGTISQTAHDIQQASSAQLNADGGTGKGGKIAITGGASTGGQAYLSGKMSAQGAQGGQIHATANSLNLAGASLDTSGTGQAGEQLIGGGWQGNDTRIANAQNTNVSNTSSLNNQGADGTVVVWSDNQTTFNGSINATGSAVEVSGKENLSAYIGNIKAKSLLLDPKNIEIKAAAAGLNVTTIANPNNTSGDGFGTSVTELSNGNLVITAPSSDLISGGTTVLNVGRVYLYKTDGELISTLSGSSLNDSVGSAGVTTLSNGNYVVRSTVWDKDSTATDAGAVTWGSGSTGVSGVVSETNSLVGSTAKDSVGNLGITTLNNGNYVVRSNLWDKDSTATNAGAVTWGNGSTGVSGVVSETNSLVGGTASDGVGGQGVTALTNGNYVVVSTTWDNGTFLNAGAVTWGNGTTGISGTVDANNSLVGNSRFADNVGEGGVTALANGHYVVKSTGWDLKDSNGTAIIGDVGAATWGNGNTGITGTIDATNSLVGSATADRVGSQVIELSNGHYVVSSSGWDMNSSAFDVGAVTWANGSGGTVGVVSSSNSLVGSTTGDAVGSSITTLSNGNFVVSSSLWDNLGATNAGAVTLVDGSLNGTMGRSGAVSTSNSLVGSTAGDSVGIGITTLSNGHFVVRSSFWNNGSAMTAGAVTWVNGTTGLTGTVSGSNSLVGTTSGDQVGGGFVTALTNGNYVVNSFGWDNGTLVDVGAVTWGNGTLGVTGTIDANNSLLGSKAQDYVGIAGVTSLTNGNYVVASRLWDSDSAADVGAVTWGNGTTGTVGTVSAANSLVGSTVNDNVGGNGVIALSNGNYVTRTNNWDNVGATNAGAVTWGNGTTGTVGTVSASNSLVGSIANDNVGNGGIKALSNGNYVVGSSSWDNGSTANNAGAATWGNGTTGVAGTIDTTNSLVGSTTNDSVGAAIATELSNGNYLVVSRFWDNGAFSNAGAVTWGNGTTGVTGAINSNNSIIGNRANASLGQVAGTVVSLANGYFSVADAGDAVGGKVYISNGGSKAPDSVSSATFSTNPSANSVITPDSITTLLNAGTAVTLQANNDITVTDAITANNTNGNGGTFKLQAGRNIAINNAITTDNGDFIAVAGATGADANNKDAGSPTITLGSAGAINAGTGKINLVAQGTGASFVNNSSVATPLQAAIASIFLPTYNVTGNTYFTKGNLTTTGKLYNTSYNETTDTGSCGFAGCVMPTSGINVFYAATPTISVTPTTGQTSTYGNSFTASGSALSGFVDGDTAQTAGISGTASFTVGGTTSGSGNYTAGSHDIAYSSGLASSLGYTFADASAQTGELTVAKKEIAISGLTASNKTYDGTRDASLTGTASINAISGDTVSVAGTAVGSFADKNAGTAKAVTVSGLTLSGADAANYTVGALSSTADIAKASISAVTGITANNKTYDGNRNATLVTTSAGFTGMVMGDSLSVATATGNFSDKNAADGKTVNITDISLGGTDAINYTLASNTASTTANISKANISAVTGITASNKVYDATTTASLTTSNAGFTGMLTGDNLTVATATGNFIDKSAANGKTVNITDITLGGSDAGNYSASGITATTTANISKKDISITGLSASNKVYDGTTTANLTGNAIVTAIDGDTVNVAGTATGSFANKNVGTAKAVTVSGLTLSGADAANYTVGALSSTADITRLNSVTWTGNGGDNNWFNPANWAGGAVPDLSNVANVVLPTGVSVSFNTTNVTAPADASQAVNIDSLMGANSAAGGSLTQANGSLMVGAGGINLTGLTQNGGSISSTGNVIASDLAQTNGTLNTTGNLTVSNSFSQSATGIITVGGNTNITDLTDGVALGNVNTTGTTRVTSRGGAITQVAGTAIASIGTSTWVAQSSSNPATDYDITLTNTDNDFTGAVTATGRNISITDKNALNAALTSTGNSSMNAAGDLAVSGSSTGNLVTNTTNAGTTSFGATSVGGNLASTSAGDVTQTGALTVTGTTALTATGKDVTLDNVTNRFVGAMSLVAKDVVIGASQLVTVASRDVNSLRLVGNAAPTVAPTSAPTASPANAARGTAAQIPVQPVVTTPIVFTPVFVATTPTVGLGTANVGTNGVSGGLVFVDAPTAPPENNATLNNNAKPTTTNSGASGIDASGFMRVSVVNGGINSGSGNNE